MTTFDHALSFSGAKFKDSSKVEFFEAVLPDTIDFTDVKSNQEIDLTNANYYPLRAKNKDSVIHIFIENCDIGKLKLDYRYFELSFNRPGYDKRLTDDDKETIYEALLKNFKDRGQLESYQKLDIEYQNFKWKKDGFGWLTWLPAHWWNYGYSKALVFVNAFIFLSVFTFFNFWFFGYLNGKVYKLNYLPIIPFKRPFLRAWYVLIYSSIIFFGLTLKTEKIDFNHKSGSLYIMLFYLLGIISLAYMANFVLQK